MLADDHGLFRAGIRMQLERLLPTADFIEADSFYRLDLALGESESIDFAFIDLLMPDFDWPKKLPELILRLKPGRCVVISGIQDPSIVRQVMREGAAGFIPKSLDTLIIGHAIRIVLDGGTYLPAEAMDWEAKPGPAPQLKLTPRQMDVMRLVLEGASNKKIAFSLSLSESTVKLHVNAIFKTLNARNRTEAAMIARAQGLFT